MSEPRKKILIVDDSKTESMMCRAYLERDYDVEVAANAIEFYAELATALPDVILMDIVMKDITGFELVAQIKQKDEYRGIPVIFLSGLTDESDIVKGFEVGAHDYLRKPFGAHELRARIASIIKIKSLEEQLKLQSITDYLTGAYNRRHFFEVAESHAQYCARMKKVYCLALFDIDHFKKINDEYGHDAGDAVLIHLVSIVKAQLRAYDVFARHGGEEFVIQFVDCTPEKSLAALERIRAQIASEPAQFGDNKLSYTFSAGLVTCLEHIEPTEIEKLLTLADKRLYEAKAAGRNKIIFS